MASLLVSVWFSGSLLGTRNWFPVSLQGIRGKGIPENGLWVGKCMKLSHIAQSQPQGNYSGCWAVLNASEASPNGLRWNLSTWLGVFPWQWQICGEGKLLRSFKVGGCSQIGWWMTAGRTGCQKSRRGKTVVWKQQWELLAFLSNPSFSYTSSPRGSRASRVLQEGKAPFQLRQRVKEKFREEVEEMESSREPGEGFRVGRNGESAQIKEWMNETQMNESVSDAMLVSWKEGTLMIPYWWHHTAHSSPLFIVDIAGEGGVVVGRCNDKWCVPCVAWCASVVYISLLSDLVLSLTEFISSSCFYPYSYKWLILSWVELSLLFQLHRDTKTNYSWTFQQRWDVCKLLRVFQYINSIMESLTTIQIRLDTRSG